MIEVNHETIDACCLSQPGASVESPFGPDTLVYKVGGKMFALLSVDAPRLNVKCDPDVAQQLRERHEAVEHGYHMSKRHWNSIYWERGGLRAADVEGWISDSYGLVRGSLPKAVQRDLEALLGG